MERSREEEQEEEEQEEKEEGHLPPNPTRA